MKNKILKILSVFVLILSISSCSNNNTSENVKSDDVSHETSSKFSLDELNVTYVTSPLNVPSIVEKNNKIFQKHLPGVKINYKEITSGADQTQALASGDVDVLFGLGGSSAVLAKSNGQDLKVINMYSKAPEAFSMFSKDDSIKSQDDLRGKTIGGPVGTNLHQLLVSYLWLNGMKIDDVNFTNMSIPDAATALESGDLDVALLGGPAAYKAKENGFHEVVNGKELIDAIICMASNEKFIKEHPDVVKAIKEAHDEILGFMEEEPEETREIVKKELDLDDKAYDAMYPMYDFSNEIEEEDKKGFERTKDFMIDNGMIEKDFDVNELF